MQEASTRNRLIYGRLPYNAEEELHGEQCVLN